MSETCAKSLAAVLRPTTSEALAGWHTSVGAGGKAHFYRDGAPSCGYRKGIWPGAKLADLFTRPRRATVEADHICRYCAKVDPRECLCWSCTMKRLGKMR